MRSISAHIHRLKVEAQARNYKIQDTNHTLASPMYRGVAGCPAINYDEIVYVEIPICPCFVSKGLSGILNGGSPSSGGQVLDGGTPFTFGQILNGGIP